MYRAGIIGLGRIGCEFSDCHARAYVECPQTELMAVTDIDILKMLQCKARWKVPHCELTHGLHIVSICTPPETHCEIVEKLVATQSRLKAIYCEKPIATEIKDAEKMIETCHKNNVILQINHQRRFGRPTFYYSRGLLNTGTHMFDLLRIYFGEIEIFAGGVITPDYLHIDIVEVDTDEPVFEFKTPTDGLIKKGVEHLVRCIEKGEQSFSSGEDGLESLRLCLDFQKYKDGGCANV